MNAVCECHILELRDEEFNVKKIIAVIDATCAVAKRKPEKKSRLVRTTLREVVVTSVLDEDSHLV